MESWRPPPMITVDNKSSTTLWNVETVLHEQEHDFVNSTPATRGPQKQVRGFNASRLKGSEEEFQPETQEYVFYFSHLR